MHRVSSGIERKQGAKSTLLKALGTWYILGFLATVGDGARRAYRIFPGVSKAGWGHRQEDKSLVAGIGDERCEWVNRWCRIKKFKKSVRPCSRAFPGGSGN